MKEIALTNGKFALVDDEDYAWLTKWSWRFNSKGYASRNFSDENGRSSTVIMHRALFEDRLCEGQVVDHINGDRLDNRRANLRICTVAENNLNTPRLASNTSGFKGVTWDKKLRKWKAQIKRNRKYIYLGLFATAEMAYAAYCDAAKAIHGEFARLT